jgi:hypothetical protein
MSDKTASRRIGLGIGLHISKCITVADAGDSMNALAYAHTNTLHDDIVERRHQMRLTLASLRSVARTATCVRARAIDESLATLQTHLSAGWNANNGAETAALKFWLDRSRYLYDVPSPTLAPSRTW